MKMIDEAGFCPCSYSCGRNVVYIAFVESYSALFSIVL